MTDAPRSAARRESTRLIVAIAVGCLAAFAAYAGWRMSEKSASAAVAAANLAECEDLAKRLRAERSRPTRAALSTASESEMTGRVEAATKAAKLPPNSVTLIDPQPARRVGRTSFKVQATTLQLNPLSLVQVVRLLESICKNDPGLTANGLRLTPPSRSSKEDGPELWRAEVTLTRLVYDPITPASP